MLLASLGPSLAVELGLTPALGAAEDPKTLSFGDQEPLAALLQETPRAKLLPILVEKLNKGTTLRELTAAAALANARTFGGENYFGFHTFMALAPAYQMAQELPKERQALPILKVLYRNALYTEQVGGRSKEVLHPVQAAEVKDAEAPEKLRKAVNADNRTAAESYLAALVKHSSQDAFDAIMPCVEDNYDVHSVVLPWRAWVMLDVAGKEHALTFLRQSVRKCAMQSGGTKRPPEEIAAIRAVVPNLLDKHRLLKGEGGTRKAEDAWVTKMCDTVLGAKPQDAGEAVAAALEEGFRAEDVGEALSIAAAQLVLRQVNGGDNRYLGKRCHGDSPGVHGSDATNAWRNIARVSSPRNRAAAMIVAAMDIARSYMPNGDAKTKAHEKAPFPLPEHLEAVKVKTVEDMCKELGGAIRENDQMRACALVHRAGELGLESRPIFTVLLGYAVSEDGRLHAEKYYRTVVEEFGTVRAGLRWQHLTALARVTASEYGMSQGDKAEGRAPGYEEACKLLKLS